MYDGYYAPQIPAIEKWFEYQDDSRSSKKLNAIYLEPLISLAAHPPPNMVTANFEQISTTEHGQLEFTRLENMPLQYLLMEQAKYLANPPKSSSPSVQSLYLTQTPISRLPPELSADLGSSLMSRLIPGFDLENTSIWIGFHQTQTPVHRDPFANLFAQISGKKHVRMLTPVAGQRVFDEVQRCIGADRAGRRRGEEMFVGEEGRLLEDWIWGPNWSEDSSSAESSTGQSAEILEGWEAELGEGDGVVIPKGYWHSLRGVSEGVNGSVSEVLL
jgi:hypothetical protein